MLPRSNEVTGPLGGALCVIVSDKINWNHEDLDESGLLEQFYDYSKVHKLLIDQKQLR